MNNKNNPMLTLFDEQQRQNIHYYAARLERTPEVVRMVDETGWQGMVIHSRLDETNADQVIRDQIAYYQSIGQDFEWKHYAYDTPADLKDRLAAAGFEIEEEEAIMALDIEKAPAIFFEPVTADIRRVKDPSEIQIIIDLLNVVWDDDHEGLGKFLADELENHGDYLSITIAYADGVPASAAWIRYFENSQFAELLGGSTLVEYRKRGLYTALLATRIQEAKARGVRWLTIDASDMSAPIVAKHGFEQLTVSTPCVWKVNKE